MFHYGPHEIAADKSGTSRYKDRFGAVHIPTFVAEEIERRASQNVRVHTRKSKLLKLIDVFVLTLTKPGLFGQFPHLTVEASIVPTMCQDYLNSLFNSLAKTKVNQSQAARTFAIGGLRHGSH
jgi:hypothetical protein